MSNLFVDLCSFRLCSRLIGVKKAVIMNERKKRGKIRSYESHRRCATTKSGDRLFDFPRGNLTVPDVSTEGIMFDKKAMDRDGNAQQKDFTQSLTGV